MDTIIVRPLLTEKTTQVSMKGWYTFRAQVWVNKKQAKREIEQQYAVSVIDIRSMRVPGKSRRVGRKNIYVEGSDWKKICVRLKPGQIIEAFQIGTGEKEEKK